MPIDPQNTQNLITGWDQAAQQAYYNAKLQGDADSLAYQKASAAMQQYGNMMQNFGWAPGGNMTDYNSLAANAPPMGTPTLQAGQAFGSIGYIPGYTGVDAGQTMGQLAQSQSLASNAAGITGMYAAPRQSAYTPGTFVRLDPSTYDYGQYGDQVSYVTGSGQLQRVSLPQARAMGWNGDLGSMATISAEQAINLEQAAPQNAPTLSLQGLSTYANLNASALNQAIQQADYTGNGGDWNAAMNKWVADSNAAIQQAYANAGGQGQAPGLATPGTPQETLAAQQQYCTQAYNLANQYGQYYTPYTPTGTYQAGVNGPQLGQLTLANIAQQNQIAQNWAQQYGYVPQFDSNGQPIFQAGANGQPATTLAAQEQAYTQWLRSQQQADTEWQQQQTASQNYLTLLSNLPGPADWAQYQKVLGATPQGTQDLVRAAAGQYIPGGGATTGVQPQAANLNTLYDQATGSNTSGLYGGGNTGQQQLQNMQNTLVAPNQMAPQTWNALAPSQQQMLLGVWESQGYSQDDAKALFQQSLPKYATGAPAGGSFRLQ